MSDTKEITAEQLVEVLKFTPRTYKISMWGYGGEKVMGTVSKESWDYCMANQVDLSDVAWNSDAAEDMDLDPDQLPFSPGNWYDCDSMGHVNGVSRDAGTVQIEDENGETEQKEESGRLPKGFVLVVEDEPAFTLLHDVVPLCRE